MHIFEQKRFNSRKQRAHRTQINTYPRTTRRHMNTVQTRWKLERPRIKIELGKMPFESEMI